MSNLTIKDLDYEKIIENYNKVEELEKRLDDLENKIIPLINKLGDFVGNVNSKIDERIKLYMENKESNNSSIEKSQTELVEPKKIENNKVEKKEEKEKKLDILKFIEETPKFVNTDLFVTKYSGRSKQFNIKNFNRKRANNFLRTGFGYAFDKSYNFKKV